MKLFSRRFWSALTARHARVRRAAQECEAAFLRLKASRTIVTLAAQREFLLEYQIAAAELCDALRQLRVFQAVHGAKPRPNQRSGMAMPD